MALKYKALIFDLDGTLVETFPSLYKTCTLMQEALGLEPLDEATIRATIGYGAANLVKGVLRQQGLDAEALFPKAMPLYSELFAKHCCDGIYPFPGLTEALLAAKARGQKLYVLTNKPDAEAQEVIRAAFHAGLFESVQGGRADRPLKPDPKLLLALAEKEGFEPSELLMVGDGDTDVDLAQRAGVDGAAVLWGYRPEADLLPFKPRYVCRTIADLAEAMGAEC